MRTVRIDGNIASNVAAICAVNFWHIIRDSFVLIPAPDVLININRNIPINRIITDSTRQSRKGMTRANDRPVAVQTQNAVGIFVLRRTGYDMQITANDRCFNKLFRTDNAQYPPARISSVTFPFISQPYVPSMAGLASLFLLS